MATKPRRVYVTPDLDDALAAAMPDLPGERKAARRVEHACRQWLASRAAIRTLADLTYPELAAMNGQHEDDGA